MLVDSHCHLNFPGLIERLPEALAQMQAQQVSAALSICTTMEAFPSVLSTTLAGPNIFASVGVHPDEFGVFEPSVEQILQATQHAKVVAIGETGLDYFRLEGRSVQDMHWQRERFRNHIRAAKLAHLPLVIHTRTAAQDTLRIMHEEDAASAGGVLHCFTESWEVANAALDLGFYISFSGIVTFKNAKELREVARQVPLERMLVETDSPYLAPAPHRGKPNQPAWVRHVAEFLALERDMSLENFARITTDNFYRLFSKATRNQG